MTDEQLASKVRETVEVLNGWLAMCGDAGIEVELRTHDVSRIGDVANTVIVTAKVAKVLA